MVLIIVLLLKYFFFTFTLSTSPRSPLRPVTVRLFQGAYIYECRGLSCYLPDESKGLDPYAWELQVGRAKGFIVVKGDDIKLPTPEKQTKQFFLIHLF